MSTLIPGGSAELVACHAGLDDVRRGRYCADNGPDRRQGDVVRSRYPGVRLRSIHCR